MLQLMNSTNPNSIMYQIQNIWSVTQGTVIYHIINYMRMLFSFKHLKCGGLQNDNPYKVKYIHRQSKSIREIVKKNKRYMQQAFFTYLFTTSVMMHTTVRTVMIIRRILSHRYNNFLWKIKYDMMRFLIIVYIYFLDCPKRISHIL